MPKSINVSDEIYRRLEGLAIGFDSPERVIERLLNEIDSSSSRLTESKPTLTFIPDEQTFKNELLAKKRAQVVLHLRDGQRDVLQWNASRFQPSSNLRANLWSGILRNWKEKGIVSAELSVLPRGTSSPGDDTESRVAIAGEAHWTLNEIDQYFIDLKQVTSDDGLPYYCLATFSENTPPELKKVAGLNDANQLHLGLEIMYSEDE